MEIDGLFLNVGSFVGSTLNFSILMHIPSVLAIYLFMFESIRGLLSKILKWTNISLIGMIYSVNSE